MTSLMMTAAGSAAGAPPFWVQILPLLAIFVIFYFLLIRPQQRRMKEQQAKIAAIKKGDQVVTAGGLIGKVIKVDDHYAELELGPNVRVRAVKSTIADIVPPGGTAAAND